MTEIQASNDPIDDVIKTSIEDSALAPSKNLTLPRVKALHKRYNIPKDDKILAAHDNPWMIGGIVVGRKGIYLNASESFNARQSTYFIDYQYLHFYKTSSMGGALNLNRPEGRSDRIVYKLFQGVEPILPRELWNDFIRNNTSAIEELKSKTWQHIRSHAINQ